MNMVRLSPVARKPKSDRLGSQGDWSPRSDLNQQSLPELKGRLVRQAARGRFSKELVALVGFEPTSPG